MTLLYYDPRFLEHGVADHPERPRRLSHLIANLERTGLLADCRRPTWMPASIDRLALVHDRKYLAAISQLAASGGGHADPDTVVTAKSFEVAQLAAGAVCDAVRRVTAGEDRRAICLVRPPGHHALRDRAMGFCLVSNVALAARVAVDDVGLLRVLIVDWDVHHGNGTQDILYEDGRVGFFSIHRSPFYPGTGAADETGRGAGLGATTNLPVKFGIARDRYLALFRHELEAFADRIRPELILISAGFDSHREDPIGSLGLESEDFQTLTAIVQDIALVHAQGRIVSVLEGGYHPQRLAESVEVHLEELAESEK
jgi:acetoin utilization deacetylase AcuC-like enzyme